MATNCGITTGISVSCEDLRRPGGLAKRLWLFNIDDLRARIPVELAAYVTALEFLTYRGLYEVESAKFSFEAFAIPQKNAEGGNVGILHRLIIRALLNDPTDMLWFETLMTADVGAIVETNKGDFMIYGGGVGLSMPSGDGGSYGSGRLPADNTAASVTLEAPETYMPKFFLRGGSRDTSLAYLNALTN